jgi:asparagine synthase (glutamine-hydrolysing)
VKDLLCDFLPTSLCGSPSHRQPPNWLDAKFRSSHNAALRGYSDRTYFFGPAPSFQANLVSVDVLRRQLGLMDLPLNPPFERRFPYLDRDLVEFVFAAPREQFVRPGERRSLMRRALRGVLPDGILRRTSKASVSQTPLRTLAAQSESLMAMADDLECVKLGIVDPTGFRQVIQCAKEGRGLRLVPVVRTIQLERWLRGLTAAGFGLSLDAPPNPHTSRRHPAAGTRTRFSQLGKIHSKGGEKDEV